MVLHGLCNPLFCGHETSSRSSQTAKARGLTWLNFESISGKKFSIEMNYTYRPQRLRSNASPKDHSSGEELNAADFRRRIIVFM